jgi:hypothetical protein
MHTRDATFSAFQGLEFIDLMPAHKFPATADYLSTNIYPEREHIADCWINQHPHFGELEMHAKSTSMV